MDEQVENRNPMMIASMYNHDEEFSDEEDAQLFD